jgi:hypothetical protein
MLIKEVLKFGYSVMEINMSYVFPSKFIDALIKNPSSQHWGHRVSRHIRSPLPQHARKCT